MEQVTPKVLKLQKKLRALQMLIAVASGDEGGAPVPPQLPAAPPAPAPAPKMVRPVDRCPGCWEVVDLRKQQKRAHWRRPGCELAP